MKILTLITVFLVLLGISTTANAEGKKKEKAFDFYPSVGLTLGWQGLKNQSTYAHPKNTGAIFAAHTTFLKLYNMRFGGVGVGLRSAFGNLNGNKKISAVPLLPLASVILREDEGSLAFAVSFQYVLGPSKGPVIGLTGTF